MSATPHLFRRSCGTRGVRDGPAWGRRSEGGSDGGRDHLDALGEAVELEKESKSLVAGLLHLPMSLGFRM